MFSVQHGSLTVSIREYYVMIQIKCKSSAEEQPCIYNTEINKVKKFSIQSIYYIREDCDDDLQAVYYI
jgi:hypothetical protein